MRAVVFCGPTLSAEQLRGPLAAEIHPPARQGDIYRAARTTPAVIGLIDGYFDGVPSVWHKEILWALEQGIAVFGSASMGALRAAELDRFGMIGVGRIYEDFASGVLRDDDEVAVLHGPAALGFPALSEPMVSVRATLQQASAEGIVAAATADRLCQAAKALFYKDRTWDHLLAQAGGGGEVADLAAWLPGGRVDAKARDACEMLDRMAAHLADGPKPDAPPRERMERTLVWKELQRRHSFGRTALTAGELAVLDELRLDPPRLAALRPLACLRLWAANGQAPPQGAPQRRALLAEMARHRAAAGLARRRDLQRWLAENGLDEAGYEDLLRATVLTTQAAAASAAELGPHLLAELRLSGGYGALAARAAAKQRGLQAGSGGPGDAAQQGLILWFFEELWDMDLPDDLDAYAVDLGLAGRGAFCRLIAEEYRFRTAGSASAAGGSSTGQGES